MMNRTFLLPVALSLVLAGCMYQTPQPIVYQPMGLPPQPAPLQPGNAGAIYQASVTPVAAGFRGM
ncbi:hypothetical protein ABS198_22595, partial [Acinetobacter baumannii]|uniref:hypothetical protein n=1 Tax=Acinetobacter baumannii TaxID=470 RepID=UPI00332C2DD7